MIKVTLPLVEDHFTAVFPKRCIYCGEPSKKELPLDVKTSTKKKMRVKIPYCEKHAKESNRNDLIKTFLFLPGGAVGGGLGVLLALKMEWGLLGVALGAMVALPFLLLGHLFATSVLPKLFKSLRSLAYQKGDVLGVETETGIMSVGKDLTGIPTYRGTVSFKFHNEQVAGEFEGLNAILNEVALPAGTTAKIIQPEVEIKTPSEIAPVEQPLPSSLQAQVPSKPAAAGTQTCPRCHGSTASKVFVCPECGRFEMSSLLVGFLIAALGLGLGISGLLALDNVTGSKATWDILKAAFCGFPGLIIVFMLIKEIPSINRSRNWPAKHAQDMEKLTGYFQQNPTATNEDAGKFMGRSSQWSGAMLSELEAEKKIRRSEDRVDVINE